MKMNEKIESLLREKFQPTYLEVVNESHKHKVPPGAQTHFKVIVVTSHFHALAAVERHRLIYQCLAEPLKTGVHALAIHSYSPEEWEKQQGAPTSPPCVS